MIFGRKKKSAGANKDKDIYVTIVGFSAYYGAKPFKVGSLVMCEKEPDNPYDGDAIRAVMPVVGTVGYLSNNPSTLAAGTLAAGRIYDRVPSRFYIRVMFLTRTKVICRVESDVRACEKEFASGEAGR